MTEVVLDVKLASLGVSNISPGGLADVGGSGRAEGKQTLHSHCLVHPSVDFPD